MVEVSEVGLKEEEVELDLGLSIGGSFGRSEKPIQPVAKLNGFELNLKEQQHHAWHGKPEGVAVMYPQTKREIHALRRLEARKKREEKQQNKRLVREADSELDHQQRVCKREKTDRHDGGSEYTNVNLNLNGGEKHLGVASHIAVGSAASFQHPYAYVQLNNGYAYPCVVPWTVKEKNAGQPAEACKGFRPFSGNGYGSDPNGERDCGDKKAKSDGSSMCSSSLVSDHQSSSHEGGGSSDSQSQSVQSLAKPTHLNSSSQNNNRSQQSPEQTASSHHTNIVQQNTNQTDQKTKPRRKQQDQEPTTKKPPPPLSHEKDMVVGRIIKPPRPQPQPQPHHRPTSPSLPPPPSHLLTKMPYVSTTGNGPNGKRVNGFLYRYSNLEVSIVCVCHGSTFSPAGFVQHAGGTDISHPEKHITVIPSAFG
ncbi:ninja-family protein AFP4 [Neltuma alba]|uniref:ninja-family protein AFP4 n=1 Tax=Neltuma alba TaxID=207710 RepID=UPI0010A5539F|nr:ninja-family protein AFP4-like [Prosopis alba]